MVIHTIACRNCAETRTGTELDGEVAPVRDECPGCGETGFTVLADE